MKTMTEAQIQQQHMTCTNGGPGSLIRWKDGWLDCSCGWGCDAETVLHWYEQPIRITRDRYGYHVSNGENGGDRLPERHYWPRDGQLILQ